MVCNEQKEECRFSKRKVLTFKYEEPFDHHYLYGGAMDTHNAMCHNVRKKQHVGLNNVWISHRWTIRVFTFVIACTEVNSILSLKYFLKNDEYFRVFRLGLDYNLIKNENLGNRSDKDNFEGIINKIKVHHFETAPAHARKWRG